MTAIPEVSFPSESNRVQNDTNISFLKITENNPSDRKAAAPVLNAETSEQFGDLELVQMKPEENFEEEVQRGIRALLTDAISGESFSEDSKNAFGRVFKEATEAPGANAQSVFEQLNSIGAAINEATGMDRIGMVVQQDAEGTHYYMMLSKDPAALLKNKKDILTGNESPTILKVGTFKEAPGVPI